MNINKSFSFVFEDKQWLSKLGLGALFSIIPIVNFAWTGYMVELLRNVMNNVQEPLPSWDDFGKKLTDGLILMLAGLVYALPAILVLCLPMGIMFIPAMLSGNTDTQALAEAIAGVGSALFFCLICAFTIYAIVLSVVYPAILIMFAREGTFASCFKFREVFDLIGKNSGPFFTAWGVSLAAGFVVGLVVGFAQLVLNLIPCIGWVASFILSFGIVVYTSVVYAHLFGQFGLMAFGEKQSITPA